VRWKRVGGSEWRFIFALIVLVDLLVSFVASASDEAKGSDADVKRHVEMGKKMMAAGQLADALTHFHAAIDIDEKDAMLRYWRATAYLSMGKSKQALADLDQVILLKPDFSSAIMQRGTVHLKQGSFELAKIDFASVVKSNPSNAEAKVKLAEVEPLDEALREAETKARYYDFNGALEKLNQLVEAVPWDAKLREMRADIHAQVGNDQDAISDLRHVTKLVPDSRSTLLKISKLQYELGREEESLESVRGCLRLDPDDSSCKPHYTKVKKLTKQLAEAEAASSAEDWDKCSTKCLAALKTESKVVAFIIKANARRCHCLRRAEKSAEAVSVCGKVLESEESADVLIDRGEAHLQLDDFDAAITDFKRADELMGGNHRPAEEAIERAQKLKKAAGRRNYYKILGVNKRATKKEIMKAYKKLAREWHPDKFSSEEEKAAAQNKFIDIAAAKEVLTDDEKRQKFDSGVDPLDPEAQNEGGGQNPFRGGHPFANFRGGSPFGSGGQFGGGGGSFHFNFG